MSRRSNEATRLRLADEAARYMGEHGMRDYQWAKEKAAQHLSIPQRAAWPSNREINSALSARQALFGGAKHQHRQQLLREQALRAMRLLKSFSPKLVGPVLEGTAGVGVPVTLHVVADHSESVEACLNRVAADCEFSEKRMRCADNRQRGYACLTFERDDVVFEVVVVGPGEQANPPLSPLTGKPFRRASISQLEALCINVDVDTRGEIV